MLLLRLSAAMMFLQCFIYKRTDLVPTFDLGFALTPDRMLFIVICLVAGTKLSRGGLRLPRFGLVERCMIVFALVCTVSVLTIGPGLPRLYYVFDFIYNPLAMFILFRSLPPTIAMRDSLSRSFLPLGAYLAINGVFEHFGPHALVWPKYIFDRNIGVQFARTRGSFASAEALGAALIVTFLFYALSLTRVTPTGRIGAYLILLITPVVIYTTNQRSAWLAFALCLAPLAAAKTPMRGVARITLVLLLLGFVSGAGTHFSFWNDRTLFSKRQETVDYRLVNYTTAWAMGIANPLFGVGFGNFRTAWPEYLRRPQGIEVSDLSDGNHNTFLGLFAEVGLLGLVPYLIVLCQMARIGFRVYRRSHGFDREFVRVFLLVMLTYVVGANFSDYRSGPFFNTALFVLFGAVTAMDAPALVPTSRFPSRPVPFEMLTAHRTAPQV